MTRTVAVLAFLLAACGELSATTTSLTTAPASTSTSMVAEASTTGSITSELPLVVSSSGLLGYHDGTHWVPGDAVFDVDAGEEYQVVDISGVVGAATGSSLQICEPSQTPIIHLDPPLPVGHDVPGAIAVTGATWDVTPRPVVIGGTPPADLLAEAVTFLKNRGLDDPEPPIAQYLTFDLEGDGVDEELLVIRRIPDDLFGNADSYSLVLMRKLDVEQSILVIEFSQGAVDNAYVLWHTVIAIADLNGDDKMEIVVDAHYYEGAGTVAWEYVDDDLGTVVALAGGCGA